jgi:hypothetical protein
MLNPPFNDPRQLELGLNLPSNVPGQRELASMCENARKVDAFCELLALGFVDEGGWFHEALTHGMELGLHDLEYDPDIHGYLWDL